MRVQDKEKCIVEERGGGGGKYLKKNVWWGSGRGRTRGGEGPSPLIKRVSVMVEWGYSEEEGEREEEDAEEEEEGGGREE